MSIESGHDKPRTSPSDIHITADDIPPTFGPYRDQERQLAKEKQIPAQVQLEEMQEAEARRKKRNKNIGFGAAGVVAIGLATLGISNANSGGESKPDTSNDPAAEAPANPGVEAPADPVAENPGTQPTDLPSFEDDPVDPVETAPTISPENFAEFSNEEIIEWYTIDRERIAALGTSGAREFVAEHGGQVQTFDPAVFFERQSPEGLISFAELEKNEDGSYGDLIPLYTNAETNLEIFTNTILANRELFADIDQDRSGAPAMVLQASTENFLVESYKDLNSGDDGYDQADSYIVTNLVDFALGQPEGTVVTYFGLTRNVSVPSTQGSTAYKENGTWAVIHLRHADGTEEKVGNYRLTEGMPNPYVIGYGGNMELWNEHRNEGQEAIMLFDSKPRFDTE